MCLESEVDCIVLHASGVVLHYLVRRLVPFVYTNSCYSPHKKTQFC